MEIFIAFWVGTAILSVIIMVTNPKRNDVSDVAQRSRTLAITMGFVPCAGISLIMQLIYLGMYRAAIKRGEMKNAKYQQQLQRSFGDSQPAPRPAQPPTSEIEGQGGDAANPFM